MPKVLDVKPIQVPVKVAAEMLGYSLRHFNELVYRGEIRVCGVHKARRVPLSELERWQQANLV